ncbi:cell division topological specificity factor MinE [Litorivicinus lipolyticus]|uniref:Cell division topological specificity factor n=1 Tax=Litorivicinus lipolyticus TaxID=418701 RepID=A0A5Q2Q9N5_9GAMM|nr:cell division topological specificity factor MinE [Litorivicinus lipolyticus]QGG79644.1 cell division topological specificity factor MinE [Litorivicinus lipolyticus]
MSFLSLFQKKRDTAKTAKERLQIVIAHERDRAAGPDFLPELQREIMQVVSKYVDIDMDQINIQLDRDGDCAVLELNVTLPDD